MTYLEKQKLSNERRTKKQRWGTLRYLNADGSLTPEGKARYLNPKKEQIKGNDSVVENTTKDDNE